MRTLVDIPDEDIERLDLLAAKSNRSRAAEIREAIRAHLDDRTSNDWVRRGSGYWQGRTDIGQSD